MGAYVFVMCTLIGLGLRSEYLDKHDPPVAQQLAKQETEEKDYMRKPFEPELSSASLAAANVRSPTRSQPKAKPFSKPTPATPVTATAESAPPQPPH